MDIDSQRKLDRVLGSAICRLLSLFHFRRGNGAAPARVDRLLVILLSEMGSLVLAYPMFQRIKKLYPRASVSILLFQKNREVLEVLNVVRPEQVFTIDNTSMTRFARGSLSVLARLRRTKFDVVIDCELFSRISSIFSFLSGAPVRVGFHRYCQEGLYRGDFINRPVLYNPYQHISQQFVTLVEAIDSTSVPKAKRLVTPETPETPTVHFDPEEVREMGRRLHAYAPELAGKRLVLINPGGGLLPIRAWPLEYYCRLSARLLQEGYAVGVIGMGGDKGSGRTDSILLPGPPLRRSDRLHEDRAGTHAAVPLRLAADYERRGPRPVLRHDADPRHRASSARRRRRCTGGWTPTRSSSIARCPARPASRPTITASPRATATMSASSGSTRSRCLPRRWRFSRAVSRYSASEETPYGVTTNVPEADRGRGRGRAA